MLFIKKINILCFFTKINLVFIFFNYAYSQDNKTIFYVNNIESEKTKKFRRLSLENYEEELQNITINYVKDGYLEASVDSVLIQNDKNNIHIHFHKGKQYKWSKLYVRNTDSYIFNKLGYAEKLFANKAFNPKELSYLLKESVNYLENNGYPFAKVRLNNIQINNNEINAEVDLNKGNLITIDSIIVKTNDKVSIQTIYNAIRIKPKDLYNEKLINEISTRIEEVSFLRENKKAELEFINNKCNLYLYVNSTKSNSFNGILGVQPNSNGKISITGDIDVRILNGFYKGEFIGFKWRKTREFTQDLKLNFNYPFLFNSLFGVDTELNIYKRDTSFVDVNFRIGIDYMFYGMNKLTFFYEKKNSNLISTKGLENITSLPDYADVIKNNYGLKLIFNKLDYKYNPQKGYFYRIIGSVGFKSIRENPSLPKEIYDNLKLKSFLYNVKGELRFFVPIKKRNTIMFGINGASFYNENIFANELFRIGGAKTIRGFDEESILSSSYLIGSLEYRYLLEKNSNIYLFYDYSILEKSIKNKYILDTPYSFGAGISFQTSPGIFSISYALGSQLNSPIYIRAAKVHFGFTSFF